MILLFPTNLMAIEIRQPIMKGTPTGIFHMIGIHVPVIFNPPIELKPLDHVLIDIRSGNVELIQRGFITIWHAAWKN